MKPPLPEFLSSGLNYTVRKPSKIIVPFAEARHWRAGGEFLLTQKMDGRFDHVEVRMKNEEVGAIVLGERMRDGKFYAFDIAMWRGRDVLREPLRVRWRLLDEVFRNSSSFIHRSSFLPVPTGLGGEWVEHILSTGGEGVCAKHLDAPYGEMFVCKRIQVFYCVVIGKYDSTGCVELERVELGTRSLNLESELLTPNFQLPTSPAGRLPLRGNKFEQVRIGSILKVEAFGLTESGKLREARPDKDTPGSWLVKY